MPEEKKIIPYRVGKGNRPKVEQVINYCLDGDLAESALNFAAWLRENGMKITIHSSTTRGHNAKYKGEYICRMIFFGENDFCNENAPAFWTAYLDLWHWKEYEKIIVNEQMYDIIWENLRYCNSCMSKGRSEGKIPIPPCNGGVNIKFFGKDFKGLCKGSDPAHTTFPIRNSGNDTIRILKRLIELVNAAGRI